MGQQISPIGASPIEPPTRRPATPKPRHPKAPTSQSHDIPELRHPRAPTSQSYPPQAFPIQGPRTCWHGLRHRLNINPYHYPAERSRGLNQRCAPRAIVQTSNAHDPIFRTTSCDSQTFRSRVTTPGLPRLSRTPPPAAQPATRSRVVRADDSMTSSRIARREAACTLSAKKHAGSARSAISTTAAGGSFRHLV